MFHIKICGLTSSADAQLAVASGADAIGVNFYARSPRCVTEQEARAVLAGISKTAAKVGVFVNMPVAGVASLADALGLDYVQLHGEIHAEEPPEVIAELAPRPVVRAFRAGQNWVAEASDYLARCKALGHLPSAVLVDAAVPGEFGGTGRQVDWEQLVPPRDWLLGLPLILAGGLTPENVGGAISRVRPEAVDAASGVESSPGCKDPQRLRRFIAAAREALDGQKAEPAGSAAASK